MPDATLRLGGYQAETSILTRPSAAWPRRYPMFPG